MWTKDYLVRGFSLGRRQRLARWGWYKKRSWLQWDKRWTPEDEWQALYRVEDARRKLKQARAKLDEDRRIVLAWDVIELRQRIEAAEREVALSGAAAERAALQKIQEERWKKEAQEISAEAKAGLTPDRIWMAWAWANGKKQTEIAKFMGHKTSTTVNIVCRQYVIAHYPENLYRDERFADRVDHRGDRHTLIKLALEKTPEPPRPATWREVAVPRLEPPPQVAVPVVKWKLGNALAEEVRSEADSRRRWVWAQRQAGFTYAQIGRALGLSSTRIGQILGKEERRRARAHRWLWQWYAERAAKGLGRPLDIDANKEDYRGKWLYD